MTISYYNLCFKNDKTDKKEKIYNIDTVTLTIINIMKLKVNLS